jgi:peptide/nickel transport system permease protein
VARALDVLFAFPGLLLAILAVAMFGTGLVAPAVALVIVYVPYVARVVRSAALRERQLSYVRALTVQGVGAWQICLRHMLPNLLPVVVAQATVAFSFAFVDLAAINFIGLGIQPPQADWGSMVGTGQGSLINGHPQETRFASGCIVLVVVSVNLLAERLGGFEERVS